MKCFRTGGEEPALPALLEVACGGLLKRPYGLFAIGMTFPEPRFVEGALLFGGCLVASFKAFSNALSVEGSNGVPDAIVSFDPA